MTSIKETMVYYYQSTSQVSTPKANHIKFKNVTTQQGSQKASQAFDKARAIPASLFCLAARAERKRPES